MDGRDEAARWISLALKLLVNRDLVGTKTFAIRAKEADPTMGYAEEILAVVDTLMSAQQQQINGKYDWYAILGVERLCRDAEVIAGEYRRLALLLNPQRNGLPFAEEAFGLVNEAWSVLSNPLRKSLYDNELSWLDSSSGLGSGGVRTHHQVQQHQFLPIQKQNQPQPQNVTPVRVQQQVVTQLIAQAELRQQQYQHAPQQVQQQAPYQPQFQPLQQPQQQAQFQQLPQQQSRVQSQPVSQLKIQAQPLPWQRVQSQPASQPQAQSRAQAQVQSVQSQPVTQPQAHRPPRTQVQSQPVTQAQTQPRGHTHPQQHKQQPQIQQNRPQQRQQEPIPVQGDPSPPLRKTPVRNMEEEEKVEVEEVGTNPAEGDEDEVSTFWTACPYCYYLFEYLKEYEDCTLRCQNKECGRAFHGSAIAPPPESKLDTKASFCSWGFFPIGASPVYLNSGKKESGKYSWHPFSPMFTCPMDSSRGVAPVAPNSWNKARPKPKAVIIDADDDDYDYVLMELSNSTDGSDTDWGSSSTRKKKRGRPPKVQRSPVRKNSRRGAVEKLKSGISEAGDHVVGNNVNTIDAFTNEGAGDASAAKVASSKTGLNRNGSLSKKVSVKNPKDLGKLDLNVEFNNEVEETMSTKASTNGAETSAGAGTSTGAGTSAGTTSGTEENIETEGIGFFEGLDDFLNSLPILSAVGDDKIKAA